MSKGCNCCDYALHILERKDFRQSKGDGPEEMPHRKKGRGKKYCKKNKGAHVYDTYTEWQYYDTSYRVRNIACKCGKRSWAGHQTQRLHESYIIVNGEIRKHTYWA